MSGTRGRLARIENRTTRIPMDGYTGLACMGGKLRWYYYRGKWRDYAEGVTVLPRRGRHCKVYHDIDVTEVC
jgi:hypothetical protein